MDQALLDKLTTWRRHLHAHPELSQQESRTAAFVQERLTEFGVPFVASVGGAGIVATLWRDGGKRSAAASRSWAPCEPIAPRCARW